jgi:thioredoxin 1
MGESEFVTMLESKVDFDEMLKATEDGGVAVLDAYADWCGPCKFIAPHVDKMAQEYTGAKFFKFDVDNVPTVAQELNIRAMPTFKIFKNGKEEKTVVGANPKALEAAIKAAIGEKETPVT